MGLTHHLRWSKNHELYSALTWFSSLFVGFCQNRIMLGTKANIRTCCTSYRSCQFNSTEECERKTIFCAAAEANDDLWSCSSVLLLLHWPSSHPWRVSSMITLQPPDKLWKPLWGRMWTPCWSLTCWVVPSTASRSSPPTRLDPAKPWQEGPRPVSSSFISLILYSQSHWSRYKCAV